MTQRPSLGVPNLLTALRILLIPLFIGLLIYRQTAPALGVLFVAGATDGLDGLVARLANQRTRLGAFLDPLADKLLSVTAFVTLAIIGPIPVWFVIVVISRDVVISLGSLVVYLTDGTLEIAPSLVGKAATLGQFLTLGATLLSQLTPRARGLWEFLLYVTLALTIASGLQYLWRGLTRPAAKPTA